MSTFALIFIAGLVAEAYAGKNFGEDEVLFKDESVYKEWINLDENLKYYINSALKLALPSILENTSKLNLSGECMNQAFQVISGLKKMKHWAFSFIDSSGKMVDGILSGTMSALGNYDQCLNTAVTHLSRNRGKEIKFQGKYCLLVIKPPPFLREATDRKENYANFSKSLLGITQFILSSADLISIEGSRIALCVPSGCTATDLEKVARFASELSLFRVTAKECQTKEELKLGGTVGIIIFFIFLGGLSIIGTCLEVYSNKNKISFESKILLILQSFSVQTNFRNLFNKRESKNVISCLHGIRFLTVMWIVLMHTYLFAYQNLYVHGNALIFFEYMNTFLAQIFFNGTLSVETFFFIGGFVHFYSRASESEKKSETNVLIRLRRRIIRIGPAYASAILLEVLLFSVISSPRPHYLNSMKEKCEKHWWRNALFINNFQSLDDICIPTTWYLGADMQYYIIALATIPILLRWPKTGVVLNASIVLFSVLYSGINVWLKDVPATFIYGKPWKFLLYMEEYCRPFSHAGSYFLGVLVSYFLKQKKALTLSLKTQILCWIASIILCSAALFGIMEWNARDSGQPTPAENVLYASFSKIAFSIGISWIVVSCSTGHGGIVNSFLSWKVWTPFSKLTFTIFLIAPVIQFANLATLRSVEPISHILLVPRFLADFVITCFVAVGIYLLVENPFISVERILFSKEENKKKETPEPIKIVSINTHI